MAYTKKTTTKSSTTKKTVAPKTKVEPEVMEEEVISEPVAKEPVKTKKEFHADDMILCRSITAGKVVMEGDVSKMVYRWMDYGSEAEVEYRDLVSLIRRHAGYVFTPRFIIEDEDFVNEFVELKKFYTEKFTMKELTDILYMTEDEMEHAISALPKGAKEELVNIVSTSISNGTLDSMKKIKAFERILDVDFSLVADMN